MCLPRPRTPRRATPFWGKRKRAQFPDVSSFTIAYHSRGEICSLMLSNGSASAARAHRSRSGVVLRPHRGAGHGAAQGARALPEGARRVDRDDAVGDRAARVRRPPAAHRHAAPDRRGARLRADRRPETANANRRDLASNTRGRRGEIHRSREPRSLAVVLAGFLLIGGIWVYVKIDDAVRTTSPADYSYGGTPAEQAAIARGEPWSPRGAWSRPGRQWQSRGSSWRVSRREAYGLRRRGTPRRGQLGAPAAPSDWHRDEAWRSPMEGCCCEARATRGLSPRLRARTSTCVRRADRPNTQAEPRVRVPSLPFASQNIVFGYWLSQ